MTAPDDREALRKACAWLESDYGLKECDAECGHEWCGHLRVLLAAARLHLAHLDAQQANAPSDDEALYKAVRESLGAYRCQHARYAESNDGMQLSDAMADAQRANDIGLALDELNLLAEHIADDVRARLDAGERKRATPHPMSKGASERGERIENAARALACLLDDLRDEECNAALDALREALDTPGGQMYGRADLLTAVRSARDLVEVVIHDAGYLPEQGGYSASMTAREMELTQALKSLDAIIANCAAERHHGVGAEADDLLDADAALDEALVLLQEINCSGRDEGHPAINYREVQVDNETLDGIAALLAGERKDACREEICPCANHLKPSDSMWCPGCGEVHTSGHYDSCACDHCRPRPAERADEAKSGMSEARREALRQMCERLARLRGGEQHGSLSDPEFPEEGSIDLGELRALLDSRGTTTDAEIVEQAERAATMDAKRREELLRWYAARERIAALEGELHDAESEYRERLENARERFAALHAERDALLDPIVRAKMIAPLPPMILTGDAAETLRERRAKEALAEAARDYVALRNEWNTAPAVDDDLGDRMNSALVRLAAALRASEEEK